jgi:hypothetical protein
VIAVLSIVYFLALERFGIPMNVSISYLRVFFTGSLRPAADTLTLRKRCRF